jgi:DNA-binding FadR family transcriptional regulator
MSTLMLPWFGFQLASGLLSSEANYPRIPALHDQIVSAIEARDGAKAEQAIATLSCCAQEYIAKEKKEENERLEGSSLESSTKL